METQQKKQQTVKPNMDDKQIMRNLDKFISYMKKKIAKANEEKPRLHTRNKNRNKPPSLPKGVMYFK